MKNDDTNTKGTTMTKATGYFKGDKMEYTGKTEMLYGETAYEAALVEGHRKGEVIWTYRAPGTTGAYAG